MEPCPRYLVLTTQSHTHFVCMLLYTQSNTGNRFLALSLSALLALQVGAPLVNPPASKASNWLNPIGPATSAEVCVCVCVCVRARVQERLRVRSQMLAPWSECVCDRVHAHERSLSKPIE